MPSMHSEIVFSPVDRIHLKGIFELLVDNQNWKKIGIQELPTIEQHTYYWEKIYPNLNKKEFVGTYNDQVIGVVGFDLSFQSKEAYLWIFTASKMASQGVASKLLFESEKYLSNIDFIQIYTAIAKGNKKSINLFKRNNFEPISKLPEVFLSHQKSGLSYFSKNLSFT
jgi:RimJ/RimL family protein N-acetyltransferase